MQRQVIKISSLRHTWFIDIDGTIFKHNGYKLDGKDTILPGVKGFFNTIPEDDFIILVTSRSEEYKDFTIESLNKNCIRYDRIIFNLPYGERVLVNDDKPSGLKMGEYISIRRDNGLENIKIIIDDKL